VLGIFTHPTHKPLRANDGDQILNGRPQGVNKRYFTLYDYAPYRRLNYLQHIFWRSAQAGLIVLDHDRPLDQDGVIDHCLDQRVVVVLLIHQVKGLIGRFFLSDQVDRRDPQHLDELPKRRGVGWVFEVLNNLWFDAQVAQQCESLAALGAARVVIESDVGHDRVLIIVDRERPRYTNS